VGSEALSLIMSDIYIPVMNSSNCLATVGYYHLWTASDESCGDPMSFSEATRLLRLMTPGEMVYVQGLWVSPHARRAIGFFVDIIDEKAFMIPTGYVPEYMAWTLKIFSPAIILRDRRHLQGYRPDSAQWRDAFALLNRLPKGFLTTSQKEESQ
jgi:hypothetical protein